VPRTGLIILAIRLEAQGLNPNHSSFGSPVPSAGRSALSTPFLPLGDGKPAIDVGFDRPHGDAAAFAGVKSV